MSDDDHEQHQMLLPRADEQETFERLDLLVIALRTNGFPSTGAAELVRGHVAALFANIEVRPVTVTRGPLFASPAGTVRWIELLLYREIDYVSARMADNQSGCRECALAWTRHFLQAKEVIAEWAYLREMDTQFDPTNSGTDSPGSPVVRPDAPTLAGRTPVALSRRQSLDLLQQAHTGRIGLSIAALPVIEPVTYTISDGQILILTRREASVRTAASNTVVAFQAEGRTRQSQLPWTVLVQGRSQIVTDEIQIRRIRSLLGAPYEVPAEATDMFTIRPERVSGRLFGSARI